MTAPGARPLDWVALGPVTVTVAGAIAVLLVDALRPRRFARLHDVVALVSLGLAGAAVTGLAVGGGERSTACVPGQGVDLPGCSFVVSDVTAGPAGDRRGRRPRLPAAGDGRARARGTAPRTTCCC